MQYVCIDKSGYLQSYCNFLCKGKLTCVAETNEKTANFRMDSFNGDVVTESEVAREAASCHMESHLPLAIT